MRLKMYGAAVAPNARPWRTPNACGIILKANGVKSQIAFETLRGASIFSLAAEFGAKPTRLELLEAS